MFSKTGTKHVLRVYLFIVFENYFLFYQIKKTIKTQRTHNSLLFEKKHKKYKNIKLREQEHMIFFLFSKNVFNNNFQKQKLCTTRLQALFLVALDHKNSGKERPSHDETRRSKNVL